MNARLRYKQVGEVLIPDLETGREQEDIGKYGAMRQRFLKEHRRIIGHAVRANYLYAGLTDLYLEEGDPEHKEVLESVWRDLVDHKLYITGGCGALYNGASPYGNFFHHQLVHQAYGYAYQLPNITAYNETCANVGLVMWAYRMFQMDPKPEYFDIIERVMLNTNLASVSLDGRRFFYQNALARAKKLEFQLVWPLTRTEYITSYCCPPNLARNLAQASEYAYTVSEDTVYVGLYGANEAHISLPNGASFDLIQKTDYPFSGHIEFKVKDLPGEAKLALRIPAWASEDGKSHYQVIPVTEDGFTLDLPMDVRLTGANDMVEEDQGLACVERGPLVYCMETPDADVTSLNRLHVGFDNGFEMKETVIGGRQVPALYGKMRKEAEPKEEGLYRTLVPNCYQDVPVAMIPYFAWDNRGEGEMKMWFPL